MLMSQQYFPHTVFNASTGKTNVKLGSQCVEIKEVVRYSNAAAVVAEAFMSVVI